MKYKWLHISDLHSICAGIRTLVMRDALLDEIRYIDNQSSFSFIIITGDLSDKNKGYDEAKKLILDIVEATEVPIDKVFIVPGNHDVNREKPIDRELKARQYWKKDILDSEEDEVIKEFIEGQTEFFETYEDILGRKYPIDKVHFFNNIDDHLTVIHLNTSWLCSNSLEESGNLHIGLKKVYECISSKEIRDKDIKIAIGHHRIDDFNEQVQNHLKSMFKTNDIDLYLGGHYHISDVMYDSTIRTEFCSCRQARADDIDYPAGFIIGNINTQTDQSSFQFYSWDSILAKWTYDYSVSPAKHGKYYLKGTKFCTMPLNNRHIIVDLKLMGLSLNYEPIMEEFGLSGAAIFKSSLRDIRPNSDDQWKVCIRDIFNLYDTIVNNSNKQIHIFPLALIPLLVSFGYLIQNNTPNILIYQYYENIGKWVTDEKDDQLQVNIDFKENDSKILAVSINVSSDIDDSDIEQALNRKYDKLIASIDQPGLSRLNYKADVMRFKNVLKEKLDEINSNYDEIHLFIAAPAGLCIEIGRIIRENMYPDTYIYNYNRTNDMKYKRIINLKKIREI